MEDLETKSPWQSKTMWTALIMALAPLIPPVGAFVSTNPALAGLLAGGITAGLRMLSSSKVELKQK